MSPTGGKPVAKQRWHSFATFCVVLLLHATKECTAAVAKGQYVMDNPSDCISVGILDVERGKTTFVRARSFTTLSTPQLSCTVRFAPQTKGDTLKMQFESGAYIGDCEVSLDIQMKGKQFHKYLMGCESTGEPPEMKAVDGELFIRFTRYKYSNKDYNFQIGVRAERTVEPGDGGGSSSDADVGMIVGIIAGAIVFIVLLCVICICCYRRKQSKMGDDNSHAVPGQPIHQYEMKAFQNGVNDQVEDSPSSDHRLLHRDLEGGRPKTNLERFDSAPSSRQTNKPRNDYNKIEEQERPRGKPKHEERDNTHSSPILSDLHRNPRFRRSFHENEIDADERANRVLHTSGNSLASSDSNGRPLPPKLPSVPKSPPRSPSPQRRGEKIADIFRGRPSSSSSELAQQLEDSLGVAPHDSSGSLDRDIQKKADRRHMLRPNRERKSRAGDRRRANDEVSDEERIRRRREKEQRLEEEEEEEKRRRKEEKKRKEEEEKRRRRNLEEEEDSREYEGRFKKSTSGRKSKGKAPRMGRSRSTGNALEEMESNYQRSRSKSPSSVRSLNFIEDDDDDDDLDSNYMPFKRAGSKTSLYASRSSLYGRRRKNSMGETISLTSYAHDDLDSRYGDFDKRGLPRQERDRMFKSTGELEMHGATAQVVRECATQTGTEKAVHIYGRKTLAKARPNRMYSRGSQTGNGRERRDSTGSAHSGRSGRSSRSNARLKQKSKSMESLRKEKRSRSHNLDKDSDDGDDRRSRKSRSKSRDVDYSEDEDGQRHRRKHYRSKSRGLDDDYNEDDDKHSTKGRSRPRARPKKSTGAASIDPTDSDLESEGGKSAAASSIAASMAHPPLHAQSNLYGPQFVPVMFPPPAMQYMPGGPPMMHMVGAHPQKPPVAPKPAVAPKPQKSKWDTLMEITDVEKQRRRERLDSPTETESVFSLPANHAAHQANVYAPPSYSTAHKYPNPNSTLSSAYPDSSCLPMSARDPREYKLSSYAPSESNI